MARLVTFTRSAAKTTKPAITRDYDDRNIPDVFDVAYDTYGRDGCSINAFHRWWLDIQTRSHPPESRYLFEGLVRNVCFCERFGMYAYRTGIVWILDIIRVEGV